MLPEDLERDSFNLLRISAWVIGFVHTLQRLPIRQRRCDRLARQVASTCPRGITDFRAVLDHTAIGQKERQDIVQDFIRDRSIRKARLIEFSRRRKRRLRRLKIQPLKRRDRRPRLDQMNGRLWLELFLRSSSLSSGYIPETIPKGVGFSLDNSGVDYWTETELSGSKSSLG
jgi:hypothetical protein